MRKVKLRGQYIMKILLFSNKGSDCINLFNKDIVVVDSPQLVFQYLAQYLVINLLLIDDTIPHFDIFYLLNNIKRSKQYRIDNCFIELYILHPYFIKQMLQNDSIVLFNQPFNQQNIDFVLSDKRSSLVDLNKLDMIGDKDYSLANKIRQFMFEIGIPIKKIGFNYLHKAIFCLQKNPQMISCVTKWLYLEVGKYYQTTGSSVEKSIRLVINDTYLSHKYKDFLLKRDYLPFDKDKRPSNCEFFALATIVLEREYH